MLSNLFDGYHLIFHSAETTQGKRKKKKGSLRQPRLACICDVMVERERREGVKRGSAKGRTGWGIAKGGVRESVGMGAERLRMP